MLNILNQEYCLEILGHVYVGLYVYQNMVFVVILPCVVLTLERIGPLDSIRWDGGAANYSLCVTTTGKHRYGFI